MSNRGRDAPPSNTYLLPSDFDIGKPGTSGHKRKAGLFSFGVNREAYRKVYIPGKTQNFDDVPGPGTYKVNHLTGHEAIGNWKIQAKTPCPHDPVTLRKK